VATTKKRTTKVRGLMGVRFGDDERRDVERAAERDGVTPSTFVRIAALRAARAMGPAK
jgi:uncharacterized protein (DUF1778 family)